MNPVSSPPASVLVVDDTPTNLQLLVSMLQECGYLVRPVTNGRHALRAVQSARPDLILLDITMPEMDGYEVCRRLKAEPATRDIPVLFISALAETDDKVRAFAVGGVDYIGKPFQFAEVAARVRTHLELQRQRRELQESLQRQRELEKLRDGLTHMIAHDMRSPLLAINLTMDIVRQGAAQQDAEMLARAQVEVRSLNEMITQMLDVSRMEAGALTLNPDDVALAELAQQVLGSLELLAGGIEVKLEVPQPVVVRADREIVRRVLGNLVGNAYKFAGERGRVTVRIGLREQAALVEVVDSGHGIDPSYHEKIFEKFGQVGEPRQQCGSGLGLTFAKMAVEAHGGKIGVISALEQGSTFWFTLPLTGPPAVSVPAPASCS